MKKLAILLTLFFVLVYSSNSLKVFEINETEKISLAPKVVDPDADSLAYTFTEPLNKEGEWQTEYGNAGRYKSMVTVSDGKNKVSEEVSIIVHKREEVPSIDEFWPKEDVVEMNEGKSIKFGVAASDLNKDQLSYEWELDNKVVSNEKEVLFETGYEDEGSYEMIVTVKDSASSISKKWEINVNEADIDSLLDSISDIAITETETATLNLPDFKAYGLKYEISEPLGNGNRWKTGYEDSGKYKVTIKAEGKGFKGETEALVTVKNKDRKPEFLELRDISVNENEQAKIELKIANSDKDKVIFSAEDVPLGSNLKGNTFTWTPGYDFVRKENSLDYVLDKFRLLRKSADIKFIAQSGSLKDEKSIKISVNHVNRPFALEQIKSIEVNEGEDIVIEPKYNDPDLDKVSFSYSGFMNENRRTTNFDDAGDYIVKIVASDGIFQDAVFVKTRVKDVNRKPEFDIEDNFEVIEGDELRIELNANDPDNDAVSYSAKELPKGAKIRDSLFVWKPGFDAVNGTKKEFTIEFIANDGKDESDGKKVKITVLNKNKGPEMISSSSNLIASRNEPVLFEINAEDIDGDELAYDWDFGFFDKFKGTNAHQRVFITTGEKKVKVTVSDGQESAVKEWKVNVV